MREQYRLISIIRNVDPAYIEDIVTILMEEGIHCLEVSLSEPERGFACLEVLKSKFSGDDLLIGAGTVAAPGEVDRLKGMEIPFFVTPGFDDELVNYALREGMDVVPGVLTPSDVQQAENRGLNLVKLFPANAYPLRYVTDLKGPFPNMDFLAVGGVGPDNIKEYYDAGFVGVGIGSSLVPQNAGPAQYDTIRQAAACCAAALA